MLLLAKYNCRSRNNTRGNQRRTLKGAEIQATWFGVLRRGGQHKGRVSHVPPPAGKGSPGPAFLYPNLVREGRSVGSVLPWDGQEAHVTIGGKPAPSIRRLDLEPQ